MSRDHVVEGRKVQKKNILSGEVFWKSCFLLRGRPMVARGCPDEGRRPDCLHFYRVKCDGQNRCIFKVHAGTFAQNPLQKCRRSVLRTARALPKDRAAHFPFQRAPGVLARAPGKSCANPKWPPRWPPQELKSSKKVVLKLTTFSKKAVCKIHIDRRLESLHFNG